MTQFEPSDSNLTREQATSLLSFYVEAGVADVFCDEVQNRYQQNPDQTANPSATAHADASGIMQDSSSGRRAPLRAALAEAPPASFQSASGPQSIAIDDAQAMEAARALADQAGTLDELRAAIAGFTGCALRNTAKNLVFADGNPAARIMLVGEAPGREEDLEGLPFAGPAGVLLDRMLAAIGLDRSQIYLANMLPWRPPGNRMPTAGEQAICLPFISRQIALCAPDILVFAGGVAAKQLLDIDTPLPRLRGQWKTYKDVQTGREIPALTMFPPDYLLKHPAHKRMAWADLRSLQAKIGALPPRD
tara:strand:- start:88053 stop:88967 length:915 start_codon:yes stop_codon:yes gene_type:complete